MLLGAFYAFGNVGNPDRLPQAAQSMRELLDRLPLQYEGAPPYVPVGKSADHMHAIIDQFDKAKQTSTCFDRQRSQWDGTIDAPLQNLLVTVDAIVDEQKKAVSKQERKKRFMRDLDPTGEPLPQVREASALKKWRDYDDYFQKVAHHNRPATHDDFEASINGCVRMLLGHLKPATSATLDALDEIIKKAESK
jgi:hypothetical protein